MITTRDINADRDDYAEHAKRFWTVLQTEGATRANIESEAASVIAERWVKERHIKELLTPLLSNSEESVRYAAAADLLRYEATDDAINVLINIANQPEGLLAPTAKLLLMKKGLLRR